MSNHHVVHLKLTQYCKSTIVQLKNKYLYQTVSALQASDLLSHPHRQPRHHKGMPLSSMANKPTHAWTHPTFLALCLIKVPAPEPLYKLLTLPTCSPPSAHPFLPVSAPAVFPQSLPWPLLVSQSPSCMSSWHCVTHLLIGGIFGVFVPLFVHCLSYQWAWAWGRQGQCPWSSPKEWKGQVD